MKPDDITQSGWHLLKKRLREMPTLFASQSMPQGQGYPPDFVRVRPAPIWRTFGTIEHEPNAGPLHPPVFHQQCGISFAALDEYELPPEWEKLHAKVIEGMQERRMHAILDTLSASAPAFTNGSTGTATGGGTLTVDDVLAVISHMPAPTHRNPFVQMCINAGVRVGERVALIIPEPWKDTPQFAEWLAPDALLPWMRLHKWTDKALLMRAHIAAFQDHCSEFEP